MEHQTIDWGRMEYNAALKQQLQLVSQRRASEIPDTLILTEHDPVYTIGARPGAEKNLIWEAQALARRGIQVVKTNRGGDITYHGPGQIVGYPIISLAQQKDLHAYLRDLEDVMIKTVAHFGIGASRREGKTGIWIEDRKIAAIGVAVKTWVTYHGFAINVDPDLRHFTGIVPCGITDGSVTSLARECGVSPILGLVKARLVKEFWRVFGEKTKRLEV